LFRPDSPARALARILCIRATINPAPRAGVRIPPVFYPATPEGILRDRRTGARGAVNKIGKRSDDLRRRGGSKGFRSIGRKRGCLIYRYADNRCFLPTSLPQHDNSPPCFDESLSFEK